MRLSHFASTASWTIASVGLAVAVGARIRGTVELSFDDHYRLLRSKDYVYQLDASKLSAEEKRRLAEIGSTAALTPAPGAIVRAWSVLSPMESRGAADVPLAPDALAASESGLRLTGRLLPSPSTADFYVQVGATILQIRASEVSDSERRKLCDLGGRVTLDVPRSAVRFAWAAPSERIGRAPAFEGAARAGEHYRIVENMVEIAGTVLPSYDDASIQVQSGVTFFQIDRAVLTETHRLRGANPGERISLRVPVTGISFVWSRGDGKPVGQLLRAMDEAKK